MEQEIASTKTYSLLNKVAQFSLEFSFEWPFITLLIVLVIIITFKKELKKLIGRIKSLTLKKGDAEATISLADKQLKQADFEYKLLWREGKTRASLPDTYISKEDVEKSLIEVMGEKFEADIKARSERLYLILTHTFFINTHKQLKEFISDDYSRKPLRELYSEILQRELDPTGFVCYGPLLHLYGSNYIAKIRQSLLESEEYKSSHVVE